MKDNKYNRIEALELFKNLTEEIKNIKTNDNYFKNENKKWQKRIDDRKIIQDSLKMSFEKLHKPFTI